MIREIAKISVSRHQRDFLIQTRLRDQRIGAGLETATQKVRVKLARALSVTVTYFELRKGADEGRSVVANYRVAD